MTTMISTDFYKKTEQYVTTMFQEHPMPDLHFHNLAHTIHVVDRTKEIAGHYYLSENDMLAVYVAAWFHDTGYLFTEPEHHEEKSVELMEAYMKEYANDEQLIEKIKQCILATRPPRNHSSLLFQIICDADTYHLGTKDFKNTNQLVWEEYKVKNPDLTEHEWIAKSINLLTKHEFYTKYCKDLLDERKNKNMKKLHKKSDETTAEKAAAEKAASDKTEAELSLAKIEKDNGGLMSKGIQTMLRLTSTNHFHLSDMADSKAHILISVNAIIISVILSVLLRRLEETPYLTIPTIIFLMVSVATIVISIIATRPKVTEGKFTSQDVAEKKTNLLFFGNFYKTSFEDYNVAMREMMKDTDYLYGSLIKDIYTLGTVLGRKYKLVRLAYNVFMIGIVVSVLAFGLAIFINNSTASSNITPQSVSPF
ncbi:Pycsar system effector family protein [Lacibacter sp. H375]|uniref:Pycsar system effector family protein n=1 Tax=Lacibacter sp. H375 TaxID=3133424 RepID=UPI0030C6536E